MTNTKNLQRIALIFLVYLFSSQIEALAFPRPGRAVKKAIIRIDSTLFSDKLLEVEPGTELTILGEKYDWYKIIAPDKCTGFVDASYISAFSKWEGAANTDNINIRSAPDLKSPIIGKLNNKNRVRILAGTGKWYKINVYPYAYAWVSKKTVELIPEEELRRKEEEEKRKRKAEEERIRRMKEERKRQEEERKREAAEKARLEELERLKKPKPIASGILKAPPLFSRNYRLKDKKGKLTFLTIPKTKEINKFVNKKINVWGTTYRKYNKDFIKIEKIELVK